jgi:hypothetical protein
MLLANPTYKSISFPQIQPFLIWLLGDHNGVSVVHEQSVLTMERWGECVLPLPAVCRTQVWRLETGVRSEAERRPPLTKNGRSRQNGAHGGS